MPNNPPYDGADSFWNQCTFTVQHLLGSISAALHSWTSSLTTIYSKSIFS